MIFEFEFFYVHFLLLPQVVEPAANLMNYVVLWLRR